MRSITIRVSSETLRRLEQRASTFGTSVTSEARLLVEAGAAGSHEIELRTALETIARYAQMLVRGADKDEVGDEKEEEE
jgi:hypothetical protein